MENSNSIKPYGMTSIKEIYKIGRGPSSSHTIGPERACKIFKEQNPDVDSFKAVLYGSLAKTGEGHGTDTVIKKTFLPIECEIEFNIAEENLPHPNTMTLFAFKNGVETARVTVYSVGGGYIRFEGESAEADVIVYPHNKFSDIAAYCKEKSLKLWQYAKQFEGDDLMTHIHTVWEAMKTAIKTGLESDGTLPGGLNVQKRQKPFGTVSTLMKPPKRDKTEWYAPSPLP